MKQALANWAYGSEPSCMNKNLIIYLVGLLSFNLIYAAKETLPNMAAHRSYAESFHSLRANLVKYEMKRLAQMNQGLLICLFVVERDLNEPDYLELRVDKVGRRDHVIPIDEVELHDVFDSETRTKRGTVLSIFYEKIPMRMGSYDLQVHGENVKFYEDTAIDAGMVTIITHVSNNNNTEPQAKLIEFYKSTVYRYLQRYESFMHSVNYELEKPGLQHLMIDLTLDYNESFHRPISKIEISKAELVNSASEIVDYINKENNGLLYAGTQTVRVYEQESTHSHYQLAFRFHRLAGIPANKCLNMVLDASLLRQDIEQTQRFGLGRDGKITLYDVFCSKESQRQDFDHTSLEIKAQRQRDGVWKIVRKARLNN